MQNGNNLAHAPHEFRDAASRDLEMRGFGECITIIDEFVELCYLLMKAENHIKVRSGQFIEQPSKPTRTIADMTNEMAGQLTELPKYTAYAKILQGQAVKKNKIKTNPLREIKRVSLIIAPREIDPIGFDIWSRMNNMPSGGVTRNKAISTAEFYHCKRCSEIEKEIERRQKSWKPDIQGAGFVVVSKNIDKPIKTEDEPPPTRY